MAVVVKVIRDDNPKNDTVGTSTYAAAVDAAIGGSTTSANTQIASAWDPITGSIVTTILIFS